MTPDTDTFTFTRQFNLPPDRMWHLMTDPKMREKWGAPNEDTVLETLHSDMQVGGTDHHRCGPADNPEFEVETRWYHLDAPALAVFTETVIAGGARLGASLVTYRLDATPHGTQVDIAVAVSSFVGREMIAEFNLGWSGGIANLERLATANA